MTKRPVWICRKKIPSGKLTRHWKLGNTSSNGECPFLCWFTGGLHHERNKSSPSSCNVAFLTLVSSSCCTVSSHNSLSFFHKTLRNPELSARDAPLKHDKNTSYFDEKNIPRSRLTSSSCFTTSVKDSVLEFSVGATMSS